MVKETRNTHRQAQQTLRACDDQRLSEVTLHLSAKEVEILRWGGGEHDMHVDVGPGGLVWRVIRRVVSELQGVVIMRNKNRIDGVNLLARTARCEMMNVLVLRRPS